MTLSVQTDRRLVRAAAHSTRHAIVSFTAPDTPNARTRDPINIAFVIDRSGSMGGSKIALAREAVVHALRMLKPFDRFSVVSYDDHVEVLVPSTLASREALANGTAQVRGLQARGSTDLGGGWLKGCEEIADHLQQDQVARCLLLSDGLANRGITDRSELARHAEQVRARGISTSTIGLGADFDELLLEGLSRAGAGHFYYVETPVQIGDCLTSELGETLEIVARDVAVTVQAGSGMNVATLNRFPVRQDGEGRISVHLGDLTARQDVSVVLRLTFPKGTEKDTARAVFGVTDARGALSVSETDVIWTFADHAANDAQPRNVVVDRAVAKLYAAQASAEALELNRAGRFDEAAARLKVTAGRIEQYAGDDPALRELVDSLRERDVVYAAPMSAMYLKSEHYASTNLARMRDATGKARRTP